MMKRVNFWVKHPVYYGMLWKMMYHVHLPIWFDCWNKSTDWRKAASNSDEVFIFSNNNGIKIDILMNFLRWSIRKKMNYMFETFSSSNQSRLNTNILIIIFIFIFLYLYLYLLLLYIHCIEELDDSQIRMAINISIHTRVSKCSQTNVHHFENLLWIFYIFFST